MRDKRVRVRIIIYIIAVILLSVIQSVPGLNLAIMGVTPILLIPAVVCIGMFEREYIGGYIGLFAGMLWDLTSTAPACIHAIFLMIAGVLCGLLITDFMHNNMITAVLLNTGFLAVYGLGDFIGMYFSQSSETVIYTALHFLIPQLLYSCIFVIPLYLIFRIMIKKVKQKYR